MQIDGAGGGDETAWTTGWGIASCEGVWTHLQVHIEASALGGDDGYVETWNNCTKIIDEYGNRTHGAGDDRWNSVWLGNYMGHDAVTGCPASGDHHIWIDNAYVDITQARVEIGDNVTYANCTHREIQIPSEWKADEVTVTVNVGSFAEDATAYVFVIDSDGNVSRGEEITIGSGAPIGPETPDPVDSLTVVDQ